MDHSVIVHQCDQDYGKLPDLGVVVRIPFFDPA
jgi:hypothetical protein